MDNIENKTLPDHIIDAITSGRKIEAIKLLRKEWGIGLKEAKERVELHINSSPELKDKLQSGESENFVICLLIAAAIAIYFFFA